MTPEAERGRILERPFDALSLDVGGVLVVPDEGVLAHMLTRRGIPFERGRFLEAHYRAMAEVDQRLADPETFGDYYGGFLRTLGVPDEHIEAAADVLGEILVPAMWHQPIPGARDAAQRLLAAGLRLGLTSNADGTIEEMLRRHEIAQVGPGPGIPVEVVTDSGVLGKHKPDPAMFLHTATALDLAPERICHVGDSARFDADGAAAVGMVAVHVDPLGWCKGDHHHLTSLVDLADLVDLARDGQADASEEDPLDVIGGVR